MCVYPCNRLETGILSESHQVLAKEFIWSGLDLIVFLSVDVSNGSQN